MRLILTLVAIVAAIAGLLYYAEQRNRPAQPDFAGGSAERPERKTAGSAYGGRFAEAGARENPVLGDCVLRGVATDAAGAPVAGAQVICERRSLDDPDPFATPPGGSRWTAETATDGTFRIEHLPEGGVAVLVLGKTQVGATSATASEATIADALVTMWPAASFSGTVLADNGRPPNTAQIAAIAPPGSGREAFRYFFERANSLGEFSFNYLPAAPVPFLVRAANHAPVLVSDVVPNAKDVAVDLNKGLTLRGEVSEAETGKLLAGVKVLLTEQALGAEHYTAVTDGNGEYRFELLRPARYWLDIAPERYVRPGPPLDIHPTDYTDTLAPTIKVTRTGAVRGRVMDLAGKKGAGGVGVFAENAGGRTVAVSDAGGYYLLKPLVPGEYRVAVLGGATPGEEAPAVQVLSGQQAAGPQLVAPSTAELRGRVLDALDHPAAEANVFVSLDGSETAHFAAHTDADGHFVIHGVPQEALVRTWAARMGAVSVAYGPVRVGSAGLQDLAFVLNMTATAAIAGTAQDASGMPAPGTVVYCAASDSSLTAPMRAVAGPGGAFIFHGLRPGAYRLYAGSPPSAADDGQSIRADLADGQRLDGIVVTVR